MIHKEKLVPADFRARVPDAYGDDGTDWFKLIELAADAASDPVSPPKNRYDGAEDIEANFKAAWESVLEDADANGWELGGGHSTMVYIAYLRGWVHALQRAAFVMNLRAEDLIDTVEEKT